MKNSKPVTLTSEIKVSEEVFVCVCVGGGGDGDETA